MHACACVCLHVCVSMQACVYVCMHVSVVRSCMLRAFTCVCVFVIHACVHVSAYVCLCLHMLMYTCESKCACIVVPACMCVCACLCASMHVCSSILPDIFSPVPEPSFLCLYLCVCFETGSHIAQASPDLSPPPQLVWVTGEDV